MASSTAAAAMAAAVAAAAQQRLQEARPLELPNPLNASVPFQLPPGVSLPTGPPPVVQKATRSQVTAGGKRGDRRHPQTTQAGNGPLKKARKCPGNEYSPQFRTYCELPEDDLYEILSSMCPTNFAKNKLQNVPYNILLCALFIGFGISGDDEIEMGHTDKIQQVL